MKKGTLSILKSRTLSFWIVVIACIIIGILYFNGFRITYNPELDNHWDAINGVSGWFSAISSMVAVAVAVIVAHRQYQIAKMQNTISEEQTRISDQQNKIALFEKRFEYYEMLQDCISIGELMIQAIDPPAAISLIVASFEKGNALEHRENDKNEAYIRSHSIDVYDNVWRLVRQSEFFFEFDSIDLVLPVVNAMLEIISLENEDLEKYHLYRDIYINATKKIDENLLPKVKKAISLV